MRKSMYLFTVFILFMFVGQLLAQAPGGYKVGREPTGFRGMNWGSGVGALGKSVLIRSLADGDMETYSKENDNMIWRDVVVESIAYYFYKDRFFLVQLNIANVDFEKAEHIKRKLIKQYGQPAEVVNAQGTFILDWKGDITNLMFSGTTDPNEFDPDMGNRARVSFESSIITAEMAAENN